MLYEVITIAAIAATLIRNTPEEQGLEPLGKSGVEYDPSETKGHFSTRNNFV